MKPRVAFVCVHNSCRSQIAEALGHALAGDAFESYSAGTALKAAINPDAVRLMKQLDSIDMEKSQRPQAARGYSRGGSCHHHGLRRDMPESSLQAPGGLGA